jgi:UDP-glucose 4-epimerase
MRLLVTGASGFIGSAIAKRALALGHEVIGITSQNGSNLGIECIDADLTNAADYSKLPAKVDAILHLAGQSSAGDSFKNPVGDLRQNTVSTVNLISYGIKAQAFKIIYASSTAVYGNADGKAISESDPCDPLSCYGVGKLASEAYLEIYKSELPYTAFRMFNVYGPGGSLAKMQRTAIGIYLIHAIKHGVISVAGSYDRYRDFIYIDDVVDIWLQAVKMDTMPNRPINLGTGTKTKIGDVLSMIQDIKPQVMIEQIDGTPGDQFGNYADISLLRTCFNIPKFTPLEKGLYHSYEWTKQVINEHGTAI